MDFVYILIGVVFILLGFIGSFAPVIPGPITAWLGLLILHQTSFLNPNVQFLVITFIVAIGVFILDYFIPMIGAKKFEGTRWGVIGSTVGLIIGLIFLGPLGILMGAFFGALVGELVHDSSNHRTALLAAFGSLIGFLTGVLLKFSVTLIYAIYFFKILWESHHPF